MKQYALIVGLWASVATATEPYESAHTMARAGCSHQVSRWAVPSRAGKHCGGYLPTCHRGTFGWDYLGPFLKPGRVFNPQCKDRELGPYATDGGPHVPDVAAIRPVRRALQAKSE